MIAQSVLAEPPNDAPTEQRDPVTSLVTVETVIEPRRPWQFIDLAELWRYRDLFVLLAWRDVSVRYKQTFLGIAWAVLRPALLMVIFTIFVGPAIGAGGADARYPLYVYCGMLLWTMFSTALSASAESVVGAERLITKVYFPRLLIPFAAAAPAVVDFAFGGILLIGLLFAYGVVPSTAILLSPLPILAAALLAMSIGCLLAALNVVYRDVRYAVPFVIQAGLFATPAIYLPSNPTEPATVETAANSREEAAQIDSADKVKAEPNDAPSLNVEKQGASALRTWVTLLNPMNAIIEFFRATLTGVPLPWQDFGVSCGFVAIIVPLSAAIFRRFESSFADLI
ncbi:ABC transporter permease [Stratiformator vulcanicus]|uniref:ABC-2 type transporter n=1 Tax=Stratiformator vulcanicus TaxID=2527980 RepID=A0A517QZN7_9PLAN|nr:ABC transporter permease [Stratiformator vulcanicus]QDT37010.1 ABC-2 type transporter [Stratiformator vulcanicus]